MTLEGLVALGYTATGAVVVKLVDVAIRWRASARITPNTELTATLSAQAELREDYRKRVEELGAEVAALRAENARLRAENVDLRYTLRSRPDGHPRQRRR